MDDYVTRYYLKADHQTEWQEVSQEQFVTAESNAGFRPKPGCGPVATGGFSGSGMRGRVDHVPQTDAVAFVDGTLRDAKNTDLLAASPDNQPAPPAAGMTAWNYRINGSNIFIYEEHEHEMKVIANLANQNYAAQIVTQHNQHQQLVAALRGLGWHSQNGINSCWCHVKSEPYAEHTKQCKEIQLLVGNAVLNEQEGE
jgi:hypothetical protein